MNYYIHKTIAISPLECHVIKEIKKHGITGVQIFRKGLEVYIEEFKIDLTELNKDI